MTSLLYTTSTIILILLLIPMIKMLLPPHIFSTHATTTTIKLTFHISLIPFLLACNNGLDHATISMAWCNLTSLPLELNLMQDLYTLTFIPVALFVTWAITDFSQWYMNHDPKIKTFFMYLLIFLLAMIILTSTNNLLQLFIGWEGVGIMSFLLISWWLSRTDANTAALQAIIYNRLGDIGLLITLAWLTTSFTSLNLQEVFFLNTTHNFIPLLGLILAATGKSAQFGLHPWLPAAMEGPTPVSALLHSSTMVVAGIFLLLRTHPLMQDMPPAHTVCLCLGALTSLFASLCALSQNDIKKIIAFSTTSQLGLMLVTIGLNEPNLAFFHLLTHAFFKAMLFLCSGIIIHNTMDEQDIRKLGAIQKTLPITSTCMTIGNLALMGTPFLSGFFSKDAIIEALSTSSLNAWALTTTAIATLLTAAYSIRMIFYTQTLYPRHLPHLMMTEPMTTPTAPLIRLATGTLFSGAALALININTKPMTMTLTPTTKLLAICLALLGMTFTAHLMTMTATYTRTNTALPTFLTQLTFFNFLFHRTSTKSLLTSSQHLATHLNDSAWLETSGPIMLTMTQKDMSTKLSSTHQGLMKTYLTLFLLTTAILLTL